jgi:alkylation response protein AidB-like acyl-CoA dehydrogenase
MKHHGSPQRWSADKAMYRYTGAAANDENQARWLSQLPSALRGLSPSDSPHEWLRNLAALSLDQLALPGGGSTLQRWQMLAEVAAYDLSLAKLFEGHTDALAIMAELGANAVQVSARATVVKADDDRLSSPPLWGIWAAESRLSKVTYEHLAMDSSNGEVRLFGTKTWCSGAAHVTHGLLTAWGVDGIGPQLVSVELNQPGLSIDSTAWKAVGMSGSHSVDVTFDGAVAQMVGKPGDYLNRPGFWHGGAGIAACWYGGALSLGRALQEMVKQTPAAFRSPFQMASLGKVDLTLHSTALLLREAAQWIDAHPLDNAQAVALRVRLAAEECAHRVLDEAGRALGPTAYCRDAKFARAAADLPVFIRQSHGERDFAALGQTAIDQIPPRWNL